MYMCTSYLITEDNMEALEYSGFVHSLGMQWFLPSIQAAVDFIEKQRSVRRDTSQ